jgi:hypothetical protein
VPDPTTAEQKALPREAPVWGAAKRLLFRFVCAYFVLYNFPFPLDYIPFLDVVARPYPGLWHAIVPWRWR